MAKTYTATGKGAAGTPYEGVVTDPRRSGSVGLIDSRQFIEITSEDRDEERLQPIRKRELRLALFNDADLEALTDAAEDQIEVSATRTDAGNRIFEGVLFPRRFTHSPLLPHPDVVELVANEGLPLLQSKSTNSFGDLPVASENRARVDRVIRQILSGLYTDDLPVEIGMNWYPSGGGLTNTDFPLRNVKLNPDNFRERRPGGDDFFDQFEVLADICDAFGLVCRQTFRAGRLCWHLRQPDEIAADGTIPMWEIDTSGTISYLGDVDLSVDIDPKIQDGLYKRDHSESFVRARTSVTAVHDHTEVESFVKEPGFERGGAEWTLNSSAQIKLHRNEPDTPSESAGDFRFLEVENTNIGAEQTSRIIAPENNAGLRFEWEGYTNATNRFDPQFRITLGGTFTAQMVTTELTADAAEGDVSLAVQPITAPIPEGARVPIWTLDPTQSVNTNFVSFFTLTDRAEEGATRLFGDLNSEVDKTNVLVHTALSTSTFDVAANIFTDPAQYDQFGSDQFSVPLTGPNGGSVDPDTVTVAVGCSNGNRFLVDNLQLQPTKDGQALSQTASTASVDTPGEEDEIESRTGSGPSESNVARLFGRQFYASEFDIVAVDTNAQEITVDGDARGALDAADPFNIFGSSGNDNNYVGTVQSYDSAADETVIGIAFPTLDSDTADGTVGIDLQSSVDAFEWGVGPTPAETFPLSELRARRRLRRMRQQPSVWEITPLPIENPPLFHGHEVVKLEGNLHTISDFRVRPSEGERSITLVETTDHGIN
jgi:hypothetical protein